MNGPHDKVEFVPDPSYLTAAEEGLVRRIEEDTVLEFREEEVRENAHKKLWTQFQQTAAALTQLYRDQTCREEPAWQPFQTAAGCLTLLYRESLEEQRLAGEINRKLGYQRARRDIVTWAKGKRRFIRREELLSFLGQCSPGHPTISSHPAPAGNPTVEDGARAAPLPTLQEMLDLSRLESDSLTRVKRPAPSSSPQDESMDSPASKRSRFN